MKKRLFVCTVFCLIVSLFAATMFVGCGSKSATLASIKKAGVLNWGSDPTFAPFEFIDKNNQPTGFDVELVGAIAKKLGVSSKMTSGDFGGLLMSLSGNKFDLVCAAMTITPDRQKKVDFSIPYYRADMGIMFKPARVSITKPEDLVGKKVGVQTGTTGEISARKIKGVDVHSYPDIQLATLDLENNKVDAVVNDYPVCTAYASTHPDLKVIDTTNIAGEDLTQLYSIAVRKGDTVFKATIDKALRDLAKDGTYAVLYKKYFHANPPYLPQ